MTAVVPKIDSILQLIPANGFVDFETTTGPMRVPVIASRARGATHRTRTPTAADRWGTGGPTVPHSENRR